MMSHAKVWPLVILGCLMARGCTETDPVERWPVGERAEAGADAPGSEIGGSPESDARPEPDVRGDDTGAVDASPPPDVPASCPSIPETGSDAQSGRACGCYERCVDDACRSDIAGVWEGRYTCAQGVTGLTLTIEGRSENLTATFTFSSVPENPGVPTGEFTMTGELRCDGTVELEPGEWVERPNSSWSVVRLRGTYDSSEESITGSVYEAPECGGFEVARRSD